MVRKQTWILLAVFVVLLGATFYLQKNPLPKAAGTTTPSATSAAPILQGWNANDIVWMELKDAQGATILMAQDSEGSWALGQDGKQKVEAGLAEEITAQIASMRPVTTLATGFDLEPVGLKTPARILTIRNKQGKQTEIHIGNVTPTGSGYYVQVDQQAPVVVEKTTVDGTLDLFQNALPTATPEPTQPAGSATDSQQSTETSTP
jgi:hypothetical protein